MDCHGNRLPRPRRSRRRLHGAVAQPGAGGVDLGASQRPAAVGVGGGTGVGRRAGAGEVCWNGGSIEPLFGFRCPCGFAGAASLVLRAAQHHLPSQRQGRSQWLNVGAPKGLLEETMKGDAFIWSCLRAVGNPLKLSPQPGSGPVCPCRH